MPTRTIKRPNVSLPVQNVRPLIDGHGRTLDHLRLSVTSHCNLRCLYCRPGPGAGARRADLTDAQRLELVADLYAHRGLRQLRLTGGEPLLHDTIVSLVADLRLAAPMLSLAMTTNGFGLARLAHSLRSAGLDRLNVSLDTIDPERYRALTGGRVENVIRGLDAAIDAGFAPPKLNTVVLAGHNDDQLIELVEWAVDRSLEIRFLEAMPIGPAAEFNRNHFVPAHTIKRRLESHFQLRPLRRTPGETAARYTVENAVRTGVVGIIAPVSESFCGQCRRMRLTADGKLFPCLLDSRYVDLSVCWQQGVYAPDLAERMIQRAIADKRATGSTRQETAMIALGG